MIVLALKLCSLSNSTIMIKTAINLNILVISKMQVISLKGFHDSGGDLIIDRLI